MTEVIIHGMSKAQNSVLTAAALHDLEQTQTSLTPSCCIQKRVFNMKLSVFFILRLPLDLTRGMPAVKDISPVGSWQARSINGGLLSLRKEREWLLVLRKMTTSKLI